MYSGIGILLCISLIISANGHFLHTPVDYSYIILGGIYDQTFCLGLIFVVGGKQRVHLVYMSWLTVNH